MPSTADQVRRHLVGLRMPRALEVLDHIMRKLERGEIGPLEAVDALLGEELTLREGRRIILEPLRQQWSEEFLSLAGSAPDFPEREAPAPLEPGPEFDR